MTDSPAQYRVGVDVGGTFTDVALEGPGGGLTTAKCLTTPEAPEDGVIDGIAIVLEDAGIHPGDIDLLVHGTTLATNAIIERKGAVSALVTTAGFSRHPRDGLRESLRPVRPLPGQAAAADSSPPSPRGCRSGFPPPARCCGPSTRTRCGRWSPSSNGNGFAAWRSDSCTATRIRPTSGASAKC